MNDNPYQSPLAGTPVTGVRSANREDFRRVAKFQKGFFVCVLIQLIAIIGQYALPMEIRPLLALGLLVAGIGIVRTAFVFLLTIQVYGTGVGVLLGILALVPFVNMVVLLIVNGKAASILGKNGIKFGLLGPNLSQI
jgi:hypothetical protein